MNAFQPDLIVEVTQVCNLRCEGCYAPNLYRPNAEAATVAKRQDLFLPASQLDQTLRALGEPVPALAIRGGEPTLHPMLPELLRVARLHADAVYLETHGRWIAPEAPLLKTLAALGVVVKMSFDVMHGTPEEELRSAVATLDAAGVPYLVAITEATKEEFLAVRMRAAFVPDEKIVFQKKATRLSELVAPRIGVIDRQGRLSRTLTVKKEMRA